MGAIMPRETPKLGVVIVNINGLKYTRQLVDSLKKQTAPYRATIYDQNSSEAGTAEYLKSLATGYQSSPFDIMLHDFRMDLNRIWDQHYQCSVEPYLCFLNNDVVVPPNFVEDTIKIFEAEPHVGCVIHSTNHPEFTKPSDKLWYEVLTDPVVQGWDFSLRREAYTIIPNDLKTFGGDDFLFSNLYLNNWKVAVALSSPIIHYYARSRQYYTGSRQQEAEAYARHGYPKLNMCPFSKRFPIKAE